MRQDFLTQKSLYILDVNESLGLAVLDAGKFDALKVGMFFDVVRDDKPIARLRVIDVRDRIAGTQIEEIERRISLEPGDRVLPWINGVKTK